MSRVRIARGVDKHTSKKYNRNRTPYNSFATEAMKWAYSDKTLVGEQKFFSRNDKWVLLEKSDDGYVEMGSYTNKQRETLIEEIIARNEEIHNRRRDGEIRADIDGYRNVKDEYSRYFTDGMGQSESNGRSGGFYRGNSGSNGVTDNQSGKSGSGAEVRHKSRSTVTSGQYAQMKANLSHGKVYSKKSAMELVSKIAPNIRNRSFEALSDQLWEGLNTYTTTDDKRQFAKDMAQIFVDRMMVDTLVKHSEWDAAVEKMAYLKTGIGTINFRDEDVPTLKYMLTKVNQKYCITLLTN